MKKNTGKYRLCRQKIGVGKTREILVESKNRKGVMTKLNEFSTDGEWDYYCEEEVIYQNTFRDANGNVIDSSPSWIRIQSQ
ncbi:MAG: hypothetical protein KA807_02570 [Prolixibacteraceae bacterium]|nr:hypothetical protein [Prolixibacteraceae bacterium]